MRAIDYLQMSEPLNRTCYFQVVSYKYVNSFDNFKSINCCAGMTVELKEKNDRRQFMLMTAIAPPCFSIENTACAVRRIYFGGKSCSKLVKWNCKRDYRMAMMECTSYFQ